MKQKMCKRWLRDFHAFFLSVILAISVAAVLGCSSSDDAVIAPQKTVDVQVGHVTLTCAEYEDMVACRGIPYANPPVGDLRFAEPEIHDMWDDATPKTLDATRFGSACVQDDGSGSEDCLFLNVFFPKDDPPAEGFPVMVWIHGGALIQGSSSVPGYDLPALVKRGVIVVSINYRLNAFGFLPHPALEDPTGNFGLKDQALALNWVHEGIEFFGGDPGNVTIFGESAGGHSVLSLLVAGYGEPEAGDFVHKAIVQSGSYSPTQMSLPAGYYMLGAVFGDLNGFGVIPGFPSPIDGHCKGTDAEIRDCLRNLTVAEVIAIQKAAPTWAWITPVYQPSTFLPQSIASAIQAGEIMNVPIMIGSNLNEGSLFTGLFYSLYGGFATLDNLKAGVNDLLVADTRHYSRAAVAEFYRDEAVDIYGDNANKYRNAHSMIFTDATFSCNALAHAIALAPRQSTYSYWFTDVDAPINQAYSSLGALSPLFNLGEYGLGASHSFEIQYIFGDLQNHPAATADQKDLSERMIDYWANFAKDGAPGGGWMAYNGTNIRELNPIGDSNASALEFMAAHYCGCWADPGSEPCWPVIMIPAGK